MNNSIKPFLESALNSVGAFAPKTPKEVEAAIDATYCVRNLVKSGARYTDWDNLYISVNKLISLCAKKKHYQRVYMTMKTVFRCMAQYYKAPRNAFKRVHLNNALKSYWIVATRNPFQKMKYKMLSMERIAQRISR